MRKLPCLALAGTVAALLLAAFLLPGVGIPRSFRVPGASMAPQLEPGDRIIARRLAPSRVSRGDLVCFEHDLTGAVPARGHARPNWLMWVVGIAGDRFEVIDDRLHRNGRPLERYPGGLDARSGQGPAYPLVVAPGHFFFVRDNPAQSRDSRPEGTVPIERIRYRQLAIYWPPRRAGRLAAATPPGRESAPPPAP